MARTWSATLAGLIGVALLAGCATPNVPTTVDVTGMPSAELALRRVIDRVNGDMAQIGATSLSSYPVAEAPQSVLPGELAKPVQFIWTGPLDAGVRKLADSIGYTVVVIALQNAKPIPVSVYVQGQVIGAFQALGRQAGTAATVEVDPLHQQVQVTHHV